ncbi:MAG TPA: PilN domain-containing protein [Nitrospira sp.]|nr:PilN domain-containing protein [Nitrospira sp.]
MRNKRSFMTRIADWIGSFRWRTGGGTYFRIELGSRHRAYVGPARVVLRAAALGLGLWVSWNAAQAWMAFQDLQMIQLRLEQAREQDQQLLKDAQAEGLDLSDAALRQLPAEVSLANQLLTKRNFSWTHFLSGLEEAIPPRVSIKGVRLDPASSVIHMTGAAVTVEDVTALALKLQSHPVFHDPVLGQHHLGNDGLVEFDLKLKYRPQERERA